MAAGAAVLAQKQGFEVFVSDAGPIKQKYKDILDNYGIAYEENKHTDYQILNAFEVIKSPGIPDKAPIIKALKERNVRIISEIEFAGRYTNAKKICITGSNGKTTTTTLIYHMLKKAGLNVGLAGNVGQSFAMQVANEKFDLYVIELSSFPGSTACMNLKQTLPFCLTLRPITWIATITRSKTISIQNSGLPRI